MRTYRMPKNMRLKYSETALIVEVFLIFFPQISSHSKGNIYTNKGVCNKILITNIGVHQNNQCSKQSMACRVSINTGFGQLQLSTWPPEGSASQRSTQAPVPSSSLPPEGGFAGLPATPCHYSLDGQLLTLGSRCHTHAVSFMDNSGF